MVYLVSEWRSLFIQLDGFFHSFLRPHFQTSEFKDAALINRHVDQLIKTIDKQIAANSGKPLEMQVK